MKVGCVECGAKYVLSDEAFRLGGVEVQCTLCKTTFIAYRPADPAAPGRASAGGADTARAVKTDPALKAAIAPAVPEADVSSELARELAEPIALTSPTEAATETALAADPAPVAIVPAPVATPPPTATAAPAPAPSLDTDEVLDGLDDLEDDDPFTRAHSRRKKVLGALGVIAGLAGVVPAILYVAAPGAFDDLIGKRIGVRAQWDPEAVSLREKAWPLLRQDDRKSLEAAAELLGRANEIDPGYPEAAADKGMVHFFIAAHIREDGRRFLDEGRAVSRQAQGLAKKLKKLHGKKRVSLERKIEALNARSREIHERTTGAFEEAGIWAGGGYALVKANYEQHETHTYAMAGLAVYYAIEDEPGPTQTLLENMEAFENTPLPGRLAEGIVYSQGDASKEKREKALRALDAVIAQDGDWIRAHWMRARVLEDLDRMDEFKATLRLIAEKNPAHPAKARLASLETNQ